MDRKAEKVVKQVESEFVHKYNEKKSLIFKDAKNDLGASLQRHITAAGILEEFKTQIKLLKEFSTSKQPPSDNAIEKVVKEIYSVFSKKLDGV